MDYLYSHDLVSDVLISNVVASMNSLRVNNGYFKQFE